MQELNVIKVSRAKRSDTSSKRIRSMSNVLNNIVANHTPEMNAADELIEDLHIISEGITQLNRRKNWFWEPIVGLVPGLIDKHSDKFIEEATGHVSGVALSGIKRMLTKKAFGDALNGAESHPLGDSDVPTMASSLLGAIDQWFEEVDKLDELNYNYFEDCFTDRQVLRDVRILSKFVTQTANTGLPKNSEFGAMLTEIAKNTLNHG